MDASGEQLPKVYLFKKDHDMIQELVRCCPTEETGGDLFGLWTNDGEPVVHIVTAQGKEILQNPLKPSLKNNDTISLEFERLEEHLYEKFHLNYLGKWQYMRRSERNERVLKCAFDQRPPHRRPKRLMLITADHDAASKQVELSSHLFLDLSSRQEGEIHTLHRKRVFKMEDDVEKLIDDLEKKSGLKDKESNRERFKDLSHRDPAEKIGSKVPERTGLSEYNSWWQGMQTEFTCNQRDLKVYICKDDLEMMQDLVLRYQHLETGGDLFGLWTNEGDAVIHVVLGPGQGCKRTNVSFYQDIPYLQRNGELLTHDYMLCHIGEWHSHHQLRLFQPSQGDSSTVIRNYPGRGTCGFLLIIANIVSPNEVTFLPYLYTANSSFSFDQKGTVSYLPYGSAFKKDGPIRRGIEEGREAERDVQSFMTNFSGQYSTSTGSTHFPHQSQLLKNSTTRTKVEPMEIDPPETHPLLLQEGNVRSGEKKKLQESWRR